MVKKGRVSVDVPGPGSPERVAPPGDDENEDDFLLSRARAREEPSLERTAPVFLGAPSIHE